MQNWLSSGNWNALCSTCLESKDISCFYLHSDGKPRKQCKACRNKSNSKWKKQNLDKVKSYTTPEQYTRNLLASTKWRRANLKYDAFRAKTYRERKSKQCPPWANLQDIRDVYLTCPDGFHVDHIIPLKGKLVSGLHVANNLQHLSAKENMKKRNNYAELAG